MTGFGDLEDARRVRFVACTRKRAYESPRAALDGGVFPIRNSGSTDAVHYYRCPFCRWWHVGRAPSMDALQHLAAAIRTLAQLGGPDDRTSRTPGPGVRTFHPGR